MSPSVWKGALWPSVSSLGTQHHVLGVSPCCSQCWLCSFCVLVTSVAGRTPCAPLRDSWTLSLLLPRPQVPIGGLARCLCLKPRPGWRWVEEAQSVQPLCPHPPLSLPRCALGTVPPARDPVAEASLSCLCSVLSCQFRLGDLRARASLRVFEARALPAVAGAQRALQCPSGTRARASSCSGQARAPASGSSPSFSRRAARTARPTRQEQVPGAERFIGEGHLG